MQSECYKIIPDPKVFLSFLSSLELSPEQLACVQRISAATVEVYEQRNLWEIAYEGNAPLWKNRNWRKLAIRWRTPVPWARWSL